MKEQSSKSLKRECWKLMSEWVRKKANGICFTCGDQKDWQLQQAGHWIHHGSRAIYGGSWLDYDDINIKCQCAKCNNGWNGNASYWFGIKLLEEHGKEKLEEVEQLKYKPGPAYQELLNKKIELEKEIAFLEMENKQSN